MPLAYTTIAQSAAVSGTVDLTQAQRLLAILVPGVTSGDLLLQGATDTTSASFQRLLETRTPGSGDMRFATGTGSRMIPIPFISGIPYVRFETAVPQANVCTLTLLTSRW